MSFPFVVIRLARCKLCLEPRNFTWILLIEICLILWKKNSSCRVDTSELFYLQRTCHPARKNPQPHASSARRGRYPVRGPVHFTCVSGTRDRQRGFPRTTDQKIHLRRIRTLVIHKQKILPCSKHILSQCVPNAGGNIDTEVRCCWKQLASETEVSHVYPNSSVFL